VPSVRFRHEWMAVMRPNRFVVVALLIALPVYGHKDGLA
jgi:hypothetical protein